MLLEHAEERKAWGEEMRRRAEGIVRGFGLDDSPEGNFDYEGEWNGGDDEAELDEYIRQEMDMEAALLESTPNEERQGQGQEQDAARSSFSDDEYEDIFMDLADGGMDMSSG